MYEWDEAKCLSNLAKHHIHFDEMEKFDWNTASVEFDGYYPEPRWVAIGYIDLLPYYAVYTIRGDNYRIISLRRATRREVRAYDQSQTRHYLAGPGQS